MATHFMGKDGLGRDRFISDKNLGRDYTRGANSKYRPHSGKREQERNRRRMEREQQKAGDK